jgi:hypothetical protein
MNFYWPGIGFNNIIAYLAIILLPYDSLTYLLGFDANSTSQTFPIVCLVSLIYVPLLCLKRFNLSSGHNFLLIPAFLFLYFCQITFANIIIENIVNVEYINTNLRMASSIRQGASFFLGVMIFYTFYDIFKRFEINKVQLLLIVATIPTLLLCWHQIFMGEFRVQGFSTEPSHLADYIVWIFLPACFIADLKKRLRFSLYLIGFGFLILTFSITGYLKLLSIVFFYFMLNKKISKKSVAILVILFLLGVFIIFNSGDNYVSIMINTIINAYNGDGDILAIASITDRFFGFIGPFGLIDSPGGLFGYGFGADSVYFSSMFSPQIVDVILATKGDLPSLSSLQGKIFLYGGIFGYVIYLLFWYKSWRSACKNNLARAIIPAIFFSSFFSLGPFFLPYTWYWLALSQCKFNDSK